MSLFQQTTSAAFRNSDKLRPLATRKNPIVAALIGAAFGPIGLSLYTRSATDLLVPLTFIIVGSVGTIGIGAPILWLLTGAWGFVRVTSSNQRLDGDAAAASATCDSEVDPDVLPPPRECSRLGSLRRGVTVR